MKKLIFILITLFAISGINILHSQWLWNSPAPTGNVIRSIKFLDENTGWFAGDGGTVIKTTNGGLNWITQNTNTVKNLYSVFFADNNTGFACGEFNTLIRTTNGGSNWTVCFDSIIRTWNSVFFVNNSTGYLAGSYGLMKTTNSGLNWVPQFSQWYYDVYFVNNNTGWLCGIQGNILHTTDSGNLWTQQSCPVYTDLYSISFINENTGWISGNTFYTYGPPDNTIIKTTNGGYNWNIVQSLNNHAIMQLKFINENTGYGCGLHQGSSIYPLVQKTTNGGLNWITFTVYPYAMIMNSIEFAGSNIWTAGNNIFKSSDSGINWSRITEGFYKSINDIVVVPPDNSIYITGSSGFFAKSSNNGTNWSEVTVTDSNYLNGTCFIDKNTGWAAGDHNIYKTTNAGINWSAYGVGEEQLARVYFVNENTGWATSYGPNSVCKTTNGGINWFIQPCGATIAHGIYFFNENTGYVGDFIGHIFKTTDGGNNWTDYNTLTFNWIADFYFFDNNTGYAVGELHSIFKTTDKGLSWTQLYERMGGSFYSVTFIKEGNNPPTKGYAVGSYQALYRTSDGGNTWYPQIAPTTNRMYGVEFINSYTGFIVGDNGTILYTTNGGSTFINNVSTALPNKFKLNQNYPNPFNNSTLIEFEVSHSSKVKIQIYDILGKEIQTLVNSDFLPGTYKISVWMGDYPSGVYFYKLLAGEFAETKRMVLIK
jgi:photosystem II stability/assembly factor-like uncharacterized protein